MASHDTDKTVQLAFQAAKLSGDLYALKEKCKHDSTSREISAVADELARLSTTLWTLHAAIGANPDQYTTAFNEDLAEIVIELSSVFEEVQTCCTELQSADASTSTVSWFFKQGRVTRLIKHLDSMKGTLMVMRIVLFHGKDYGTHTSDRLAESSPHTMHEDRVILESLLARNQAAILSLHEFVDTLTEIRDNKREESPARAGHHRRNLSDSTGVDISFIPDVLPPSRMSTSEEDTRPSSEKLSRTFTKRGVRLGAHMSIMDTNAHEAPHELKKKWLNQAQLRRQGSRKSHNCGSLTQHQELSRISEVDSNLGSNSNMGKVTASIPALSHGSNVPVSNKPGHAELTAPVHNSLTST